MRLLGGKKRLSWLKEAKSIFLPKKGWLRLLSYFWHRIGRLKATPYSIAAGLACGVSVSFTPLIGLHVLLAIAFASIIRGNVFTAMIGTLVGTPWTFPFIWLITYHSGIYFLGNSASEIAPLDLLDEDDSFLDLFTSMFMNMDALVIPMLAGSIPFVVFSWGGSFALCYLSISKYKTTMANRRGKK